MLTKETNTLNYDNKEISSSPVAASNNVSYAYDKRMENNVAPEFSPGLVKALTEVPSGIFVKVKTGCYEKINLPDIHFIQSMSDYVQVRTHEKSFVVYSTLLGILEKLPKADFLRVHRSFIVRIDCISKIEHKTLLIKDKLIPIGSSYQDEFFSKINIIC